MASVYDAEAIQEIVLCLSDGRRVHAFVPAFSNVFYHVNIVDIFVSEPSFLPKGSFYWSQNLDS